MSSLKVALRRKKHLLALQAVNQGIKLVGAEHPEIHRMVILLGKEVLTNSSIALNGHAKVVSTTPTMHTTSGAEKSA